MNEERIDMQKRDSKKKTTNFKKKRNPASKGNNSKGDCKRSDSRSGRREDYIRDNDPTWYTSYPGIYSATANISFNQPVGVPLNLGDANDQALGITDSAWRVPNVMAIDVALTPGVTTSGSSMINTSMFQNYNFVRHANSGSKNYDAVDLQMYFLAVDNALAMLWQGIRAFGTMGSFSPLNRAIPKSLFRAYGLDYESWTSNPAQVRARLNLAATKMTSLCIPKNARLTARHQSLFQNVFMDGLSVKSQMYVFRLGTYHTWGRMSNVGKLTANNLPISTQLTVDQYFDILDAQLQPLLEDEDINVMSGDVLKAYGSAGLTPIPITPELYVTPITSSDENPYMMSQIENMRWFTGLSNLDITQSTNGHIVFEPSRIIPTDTIINNIESAVSSITHLLNSRKVEVTNDDVIEMTRLQPAYGSEMVDSGLQVRVRSCGTELPLNVNIVTDGEVTDLAPIYNSYFGIGEIPSKYFNFDYAPYIYRALLVNEGSTYKCKVMDVVGDLSNYTTISKVNIDLLHDTAVASEFLIDQPGKELKV